MKTGGRVLLTTDFSEESRCAFPYAEHEAKIRNGSITLLHIIDSLSCSMPPIGLDIPPPPELFNEFRAKLRAESEAKAAELLNKEKFDCPVEVLIKESWSSTSHAIAQIAKEGNYELIVIASHGEGFLDRLIIGSITERLTKIVPCQCLVVPAWGRGDPGFTYHLPYRRIVTTTDFSKPSLATFPVLRMEVQDEAEVILLHVLEHAQWNFIRSTPVDLAGDRGNVMERYREIATQRMEKLVEQSGIKGMTAKVLEKKGSVSNSIVEFAQREKADLIVIAAHGRRGHMEFLGSIADRVLRKAPCPVLIAP